MKTNDLIHYKLSELIKSVAKIDDLIGNLEQINSTLTDKEYQLFKEYFLLSFLNEALWNTVILEIYMLYNSNEKFSIYNILNLIINQYRNLNWKNKYPFSEYQKFILELDVHNKIYKKLKTKRDKLIAHRDIQIRNEVLLLKELRLLLETLKGICKKLIYGINGSEFIWDRNDLADLIWIKNLNRFKRMQSIILSAEVTNSSNIETKSLLRILNTEL